MKNVLREKAIKLRRNGLSYSEIRKQVKVSKSSLSLWLRSVGLTKRQKQKLRKKMGGYQKGIGKWRNQRISKTKIVNKEAIDQINRVKETNEKLWLMGIMLYWQRGKGKAIQIRPTSQLQ
jgi:transposase